MSQPLRVVIIKPSKYTLSELLFKCYRQFFSLPHTLQNVKDEMSFRSGGLLKRSVGSMAMSLFSRYCAWRRMHPMSGGISRVRLDGVKDFLSLRKSTFGFELAPLPKSLQLPAAEIQLNQVPSPRGPARLPRMTDQSRNGHPVLITESHRT